MNKVILTGRLCADPEVNTYGETTVATYRLAVDRKFKKEGQTEADFLTCKVFGKAADFVFKYLHKGIKIAIEGRIQTGSYEKDGVKHYTTEIIVEQHEFCEKRTESSGNYDVGYDDRVGDPMAALGGFAPLEGAENDLPF